MKLCIAHRTVYRYREAPRRLVQTLRLTPRHEAGQQVLSWSVNGAGHSAPEPDAWGNRCHTWTVERPTRQFVIEAGGVVATSASPWCQDAGAPDPALYLRASPLATADAAIADLARVVASQADEAAARLLALAARVRQALPYRTGLTDAGTTAVQALALGGGVCQDQAHVFIAACRHLGLPARYVSGYRMAGSAAQASHAWVEVCVDLVRRLWLGVDVTHADLAGERHVRLALGPDYSACAPVRGVRLGGLGESLDVAISITEL